ncbi:hypothetical protein ACFYWU_01745 [Streptomyces chrestomyceticus]|uniref:hypothetical protein n=1 Tax=Streptomyces chrestomyceticus TaxID=68185 RepID=UPI0036919EDA
MLLGVRGARGFAGVPPRSPHVSSPLVTTLGARPISRRRALVISPLLASNEPLVRQPPMHHDRPRSVHSRRPATGRRRGVHGSPPSGRRHRHRSRTGGFLLTRQGLSDKRRA